MTAIKRFSTRQIQVSSYKEIICESGTVNRQGRLIHKHFKIASVSDGIWGRGTEMVVTAKFKTDEKLYRSIFDDICSQLGPRFKGDYDAVILELLTMSQMREYLFNNHPGNKEVQMVRFVDDFGETELVYAIEGSQLLPSDALIKHTKDILKAKGATDLPSFHRAFIYVPDKESYNDIKTYVHDLNK